MKSGSETHHNILAAMEVKGLRPFYRPVVIHAPRYAWGYTDIGSSTLTRPPQEFKRQAVATPLQITNKDGHPRGPMPCRCPLNFCGAMRRQ